jgi:hypothetical protein
VSHISKNETHIRQVHPGILQDALNRVIAGNQGMTASKTYKNWGMKNCSCDVALHVDGIPRGLGINYLDRTKGLEFIGDFYGVDGKIKMLQNQIVQTYMAMATKRALETIHHTVNSPTQSGRNVVVQTA